MHFIGTETRVPSDGLVYVCFVCVMPPDLLTVVTVLGILIYLLVTQSESQVLITAVTLGARLTL
jgi:hypothetical protein